MNTKQLKHFTLNICTGMLLWSTLGPVHAQEIKSVRDYGFALELYERELYTVAIDALEQFIFNNPNDSHSAEAWFFIGKSHYALEQYTQASLAFTEFVARQHSSPHIPDAWKLLAESHVQSGDIEKAAESLEALADILFAETEHTVPALFRAAELYQEIGRTNKVTYLLQRISDTYPEHALYPEVVIILAQNFASQGDYLAAVRELSKIDRQSSIDDTLKWEARFYSGMYHLKLNALTSGEEDLSSILSEASRNSELYQQAALLLAGHYFKQNNTDSAINLLLDLAGNPNASAPFRGQANLELGKLSFQSGDYQRAHEYFSNAQHLEENLTLLNELLYYNGRTFFEEGDFPQAYAELSKLFSDGWPGSRPAEEIKQFEYDAFSLYVRSANLSGSTIDIALLSGSVLELSDRFPNAQTYLRWGDIFFDASLFRTANDLYEKGYKHYPEELSSDFLLLNRGKTIELIGDNRIAYSLYSRVISIFPGGEAAHEAETRIDYLNRKHGRLSDEEILQKRSQLLDRLSQNNTFSDPATQRLTEAFLHGQFNYEIRDLEKALENFRIIIEDGTEHDRFTDALTLSAEIFDNLYLIYIYEEAIGRAEGAAQGALELYRRFLNISDDLGDYSRFTKKRIIDLTLALSETSEEKVDRTRSFIQGSEAYTDQGVLEFGKYRLAELLIQNSNSLSTLQEAVNILENLSISLLDDTELEEIAYLKIIGALKTASASAQIIGYCKDYVTVYPRGRRTPETRFIGAEAFLKSGDPENARLWIEQLMRDHFYSRFVDRGATLLADLLSLEGATDDALKLYHMTMQSLAGSDESELVTSILLKIAHIYRKSDQYGNAVDYLLLYTEAETDISKKIEGLKALSELYVLRNNFDEARSIQTTIINSDADSVVVLSARLEEAFLSYRQLSDPSASNFEDRLRATREKFLALSELPIEDSLKVRIDFTALVCLYRLDRRQEANRLRDDFERRYRFLPDDDRNDYLSKLRVEEALIHQRTAVTMLTSGNVQEAENRFGEAISIFTDIARKYPESAGEQLADLYHGLQLAVYQSQVEEGLALLVGFRRKYPDSQYLFQVYSQLGIIQKNLNRYKDAYVSFSIAVETPEGKNDAETHLNYIEGCEYAGFQVVQIDAIHTYLRHFPETPQRMQMLINVGNLYKILGQYDAAITHFESIIPEADPKSQIIVQYYLGESYFEQKKYTLAIVEFLKLLRYGDPRSTDLPFHTNARWYTAQSFKEIGDYDNAIAYLDPILSAYGPSDDFHKSAQSEKDTILKLMELRK